MEGMNICVTVNRKYVRYLYTMLLSLFENNREGGVCLYVIQRDFTEQDRRTIRELSERYQNETKFIFADETKFSGLSTEISEKRGYPLEIYFRLLIPELIPETVDRLLMLDVDLIVNHSLEKLYFMDMGKKLMAAAPNMCANCMVVNNSRKWYPATRENWVHYNTGVLLWDLKKVRTEYSKEYLFHQAFQHKIEMPTFEEEIFNVEFGEDCILTLDPKIWNYIPTFEHNFVMPNIEPYPSVDVLKEQCAIVHYAVMNPWKSGEKPESVSLWWEYAKKTPFYQELLEEQLERETEYVRKLSEEKEMNRRWFTDVQTRFLIRELEGTEELKQFLNKEDSELCLWGAGKMAERCYRLFASVGLQEKIKSVIDRNKKGNFYGIKIWTYEEAKQMLPKGCKIIITPVEIQHRLVWEIINGERQDLDGIALSVYLSEVGVELFRKRGYL